MIAAPSVAGGKRRGVRLPFVVGGGIAAVLISCFVGVGIGAAGSKGAAVKATSATPAPDTRTITQTVVVSASPPAPVISTATATVTVTAQPATAAAGVAIEEGTWTVGVDVQPGTYRVIGAGASCYWEITKSGTNGSDIVDNHIGAGNLTVTLKVGQDFTTARCGTWSKTK